MRAPAGLLKRYTNIAPRWCQALAAMVQPERRFLDAATAELCSGYNPYFAGMDVFGRFNQATPGAFPSIACIMRASTT